MLSICPFGGGYPGEGISAKTKDIFFQKKRANTKNIY